jgi:hypothetical protein
MFCTECGQENREGAKYCMKCGTSMQIGADSKQEIIAKTQKPTSSKRGVLILSFGILSCLFMGLLLGIPAWILGQTDLRRMREGTLITKYRRITRAGMILGIIGTFVTSNLLAIILVVSYSVIVFRLLNR